MCCTILISLDTLGYLVESILTGTILMLIFHVATLVGVHGDDSHLCFSTHLNSCRYVKPKHVDVAEFLQEVTTAEGVQFLKPGRGVSGLIWPRTCTRISVVL